MTGIPPGIDGPHFIEFKSIHRITLEKRGGERTQMPVTIPKENLEYLLCIYILVVCKPKGYRIFFSFHSHFCPEDIILHCMSRPVSPLQAGRPSQVYYIPKFMIIALIEHLSPVKT